MLQLQEKSAPPEPRTSFRVFVYHHTHWDREWWSTFQTFRIQLVQLIDDLLAALDADPAFGCFLLDGQAIVLRDYLEVRPEQRERLVGYLNAGRIQCGPWYILPDEFLVSGEAHIRNLWLGERTAARLGYPNLAIGYLPDTFGHIGQMPQILRGFAIESAMLWRGIGGDPAECRQEFVWQAPDGSKLLTVWFPDGYYLVDFLHFDNPQKSYDETYGRVRRSLARAAERATTDCILLPYGGDHRPIDRCLPRLLAQVNAELAENGEGRPAFSGALHWAGLPEYIAAIQAADPALRVVSGELRGSGPGTPHLLPGVLSTRMLLKQRNAAGQTWLERYAEPLAALAWLHGRPYDAGLLWVAWELLVQNHPHDSICGCSIDQVHREMLPRFDQSRQIAEGLAEQCARHLAATVDTSTLEDGELALVVHNSLAWPRTASVGTCIDQELDINPQTHQLLDEQGNELPFQVRTVSGPRPFSDRWQHTELRFTAVAVPALGHATYRLSRRSLLPDPRRKQFNAAKPATRLKGCEAVGDLRVGDGLLENAWLRVEVSRVDGTLTVTDLSSGVCYEGLNAFEDGGDAGDEYTFSPPLCDMLLRSDQACPAPRVHIALAEAGYASATLRVELEWALPAGLSDDRLSRSSSYVPARITSFVTLAAGARHVELAVEWENLARDHRLRALFPLGAPISVAQAEGHFELVERPASLAEAGSGWAELPTPAQPQQGYTSIAASGRGLLIAARGLPEYEAIPDGTLALTMLRAVGWLSRDDMLARIGHAGPLIPTPEAQCLGPCRAEYAIIPHSGDLLASRAYLVAHSYLAPLYAGVTGRHSGTLPQRGGLLELEGEHNLLLSACKKAEQHAALILRFWNVARRPTAARLRLSMPFKRAAYTNLKEQPLEEIIPAPDGSLELHAGPAQIITIAIDI